MELWLIILIFAIIATISAILLWHFWPEVIRREDTDNTPSVPVLAGFLEPCNTVVQCMSGLTCDGDLMQERHRWTLLYIE